MWVLLDLAKKDRAHRSALGEQKIVLIHSRVDPERDNVVR
jgi:hypothetical protein